MAPSSSSKSLKILHPLPYVPRSVGWSFKPYPGSNHSAARLVEPCHHRFSPGFPRQPQPWSPCSQPVLQSQLFSVPVRSCQSFLCSLPVLPPHAHWRPNSTRWPPGLVTVWPLLLPCRPSAPSPVHLLLLLHAGCAPTSGQCCCWSSEICKFPPSPLPSLCSKASFSARPP